MTNHAVASSRPEEPAAGERTAALIMAALGAALLVAAAGTFIAVSWDRLGLEMKAGLVALVATVALGSGCSLRAKLPGTAAVLIHLGGFLIPIDVGAVATAFGLERAEVGVLAGIVGVVTLALLDRTGSPFMVLGRVFSIGAAALGAGALLGLPPAVPLLMAGTALLLGLHVGSLGQRRSWRLDALGTAVLAGLSPALDIAASYTLDGSFIDWLAELTRVSPITSVALAIAAIGVALLADHRLPGPIAACGIAVLALPDVIAVMGAYPSRAVVLGTAALVAARFLVLQLRQGEIAPLVDGASVGFTTLLALVTITQDHSGTDLGFLIAAALTALSWLISDVESGSRIEPEAPWYRCVGDGHTGWLSTLGIGTAVLLAAFETGNIVATAYTVVAGSTFLGLGGRRHATAALRIGLLLATLIALSDPLAVVSIGLGASILLQARSILDLAAGAAPQRARSTQRFGLASFSLGIVAYAAHPIHLDFIEVLLVSAASAATLLVLGFTADQLPIPDLRSGPRLLLPITAPPLFAVDPTMAGLWAVGSALLLFLDTEVNKTPNLDVVAALTLFAGSWIVAIDQDFTFIEAYLWAPAAGLLWFGRRVMQAGQSSWIGLAPGIALVGFAALLERLTESAGWHATLAGVIGLVSLVIGVERKWGGPAVVGAILLGATVIIEASAVVPHLPVWMLLAAGGSLLLGTGVALERRAGAGRTAPLAATWRTFS